MNALKVGAAFDYLDVHNGKQGFAVAPGVRQSSAAFASARKSALELSLPLCFDNRPPKRQKTGALQKLRAISVYSRQTLAVLNCGSPLPLLNWNSSLTLSSMPPYNPPSKMQFIRDIYAAETGGPAAGHFL